MFNFWTKRSLNVADVWCLTAWFFKYILHKRHLTLTLAWIYSLLLLWCNKTRSFVTILSLFYFFNTAARLRNDVRGKKPVEVPWLKGLRRQQSAPFLQLYIAPIYPVTNCWGFPSYSFFFFFLTTQVAFAQLWSDALFHCRLFFLPFTTKSKILHNCT